MDVSRMINRLKNVGIQFEEGMTEKELDSAEKYFQFRFPIEIREFLSCGVPVGSSFFDYRDISDIITDFQIVSADTAHVLSNKNTNSVILYQFDHSLPLGSVEIRSRVPVIHEKFDITKFLVLCVLFEDGSLIYNGVALTFLFIVTA